MQHLKLTPIVAMFAAKGTSMELIEQVAAEVYSDGERCERPPGIDIDGLMKHLRTNGKLSPDGYYQTAPPETDGKKAPQHKGNAVWA